MNGFPRSNALIRLVLNFPLLQKHRSCGRHNNLIVRTAANTRHFIAILYEHGESNKLSLTVKFKLHVQLQYHP